MANFRLGAALAGVLLVGFAVLQMFAIARNYNQPPNLQVKQKPRWRNRPGDAASDNSLFLLGTGKADITG